MGLTVSMGHAHMLQRETQYGHIDVIRLPGMFAVLSEMTVSPFNSQTSCAPFPSRYSQLLHTRLSKETQSDRSYLILPLQNLPARISASFLFPRLLDCPAPSKV